MVEKIILIDSTFDLIKNSKIICDKKNKVITLDHDVHKKLNEKNIQHSISENFIDDLKLKQIQTECIKFSNWHKNEDIKNILLYKEIEIGDLYKLEFHNFLIPFIKKNYELQEIKKKFSTLQIVCSSNLYHIAKNIFENVEKIDDDNDDIVLEDDKIKYRIFDKVNLEISKESFQKLKKMSEITLKQFIKKDRTVKDNKTGAFIEFDTLRFEKLFMNIENQPLEVFLYNQRRPIFWNKKSFSIIKNSNIIPYSSSDSKYHDDTNFEEAQRIFEKFEKFLMNSSFLKNYFVFNGKSFGESLRPFLLQITKKKIQEAIKAINTAIEFIRLSNISFIVILSEIGFTEQIMINLAKKQNIKIILLQHGLFFYVNDALEYNKLTGVLPIKSDNYFAWGEESAEYAELTGFSKEKIRIVGNMNLDRKFNKNEDERKKVLLLATGPRNQHHAGYDSRQLDKFEEIVLEICKITSQLDLQLIIKQHSDPSEHELSKDIEKKFSNVKILKNSDPLPLQYSSDFVFSLGLTTGVLEAQLFGKPVILFQVDYEMFCVQENLIKSCLNTNLKELKEKFSNLIKDENLQEDIIKKGKLSVNRNISNTNNSSEVFLKAILSI